ncbi:MAG: MBL fold metallo-hydrolase [Lentisphaerae bacterium]|nr:MBL fold metallo-hydrolase [Lentisphaerota bacterium]
MKMEMAIMAMMLFGGMTGLGQEGLEKDVLKTSAGDLEITFVGHGSLLLAFGGKTLHVDPYSRLTDYTKLPKAELVLITHDHPDHLDAAALRIVQTSNTVVVLPPICAERVTGGTVMTNGEVRTMLGIKVEAVPAYNLVHKRDSGRVFHPKGEGNGYVLTFGDKRIYVAGDTENTPEMKLLQQIDCAFLPMNLPYTMTPEMVADAARVFKPKILYPYHFGDTDPAKLKELLAGTPDVEVRIRRMK